MRFCESVALDKLYDINIKEIKAHRFRKFMV